MKQLPWPTFGCLASLYAVAAWLSIFLSKNPGSIATLWWANAVAVGFLLFHERKQWGFLLLAAAIGNVAANYATGDDWQNALKFLPGNLVEIVVAASLIIYFNAAKGATDTPIKLALFVVSGAGIASAIGALLGALILSSGSEVTFAQVWFPWFLGDAIGSIAILPIAAVLIDRGISSFKSIWERPDLLALLVVVVAVGLWAPVNIPYPFIYVTFPILILAAIGGLAAASVGVLLCSLCIGVLLAYGSVVMPYASNGHGELLFYAPLVLALMPPLFLAVSKENLKLAMRKLAQSQNDFKTLYERTPMMMHSIDKQGRIITVTDLWLAKLGYSRSDVIGRRSVDFLAPESRERAINICLPEFFRTGRVDNVDYQMIASDGAHMDVRLSACQETSEDGEFYRSFAIIQDVSEEVKLAKELDAEQELFKVTLKSIGDGVVCTDVNGRITFINSKAEEILGWSQDEASGKAFGEVVRLVEQGTGALIINPVERCLAVHDVQGIPDNSVLISRSGKEFGVQDSVAPIIASDATLLGAVMVFQDVTEARALAIRMSYLAHHDVLTELPNRILLQDRIVQGCSLGARSGTRFAVMFMDLDHFKHVNDSLGHAVGDELLKTVAQRLKGCLRTSDTVCRLGGDEFVMLLQEVSGQVAVADVARKIIDEVSRPVFLNNTEVTVGISLGIAIFPEDGGDADALMKHADAAMYRAKRDGRKSYKFYSEDYDHSATERLQIESDLRRALSNGEFVVHFQPQVDALNLRPTGVEALVRWNREGKIVGPDQFIPVAEESGLIVGIGLFVLRAACTQWLAWQGTAAESLRISVNVSPMQLGAPNFVDAVAAIFREFRVCPSAIEMEITETVLMKNPSEMLKVLGDLRSIGCRIAIDDFGTGYSSLSHIKHFPVDVVKIDRAFIRDMEVDPDDRTIVRAIVAMAKALRLDIVAEGVETEGQASILRDYGCQFLQGYAFAKPAPPEETSVWISQQLRTANKLTSSYFGNLGPDN